MPFWSSSSSSSSSAPAQSTAAQPIISSDSQKLKQDIQNQISQELAVANATELVRTITENCFDKCIDTPQAQFDHFQETCIAQCKEKYMRSWNTISRAYIARIQNQS
ncbi:TIM13 [Candida metapsilosis]|uniref:Mitochondrial import inner membrane translocase subunit n=1 Tax=Candida metapsilosis TaxID=273372 RepID=A0A8H7ZGL6_9ASCO|nr:TIM13 [Candida metapsilosis]